MAQYRLAAYAEAEYLTDAQVSAAHVENGSASSSGPALVAAFTVFPIGNASFGIELL
jgi:hypothetical protein